jgi:hypothetical protein
VRWNERVEANLVVVAPLSIGHRNFAGDEEIRRQMVVDGDRAVRFDLRLDMTLTRCAISP